MKKPSIFVIFLTVFIDLIGFGIVLPLLPLYTRDFGAPGWLIGVIMASYSIMQFIFAPIWGRWSDRIGRRPVLRISLMGSVISYLIFAWGTSFSGQTALWILLASRVFAGICGANITVAQAYIADVTPPDKRSRGMGLIGMAFGLGFIFGPGVGALSHQHFGMMGPGLVAAGMSGIAFLMAIFVLKESWQPSADRAAVRPRLQQWKATLGQPTLGFLILVFFVATFGFSCFETTLGLVVSRNFHLDPHRADDASTIGWLFTYCGLIVAFVQGGAVGRLVKKFGEPKLIAGSLVLFAVSMAVLPFIHGDSRGMWALLLVFLATLGIGSSLVRPPVFGMISILASDEEQGATIGVAQSMGSLARIFGPIFAGAAYQLEAWLPYLVCAGLVLVAGILAWVNLCRHGQPVTAGNANA